MAVDIDTTPEHPIVDFETFLNLFEDEPKNLKYKKRIAEAYSRSERFIYVDLEDLLNFNPTFFNYLKTSPDQAIEEMIEAFKNCMRMNAGGLFNPDEPYFVYCRSNSNLLLTEIRQISSRDLCHLILVDGEIMGISKKYFEFLTMAYECPICGNIMTTHQSIGADLQKPSECSNPNCNNKRDFIKREEDSDAICVRTAYISDKTQPLKLVIPYFEDQHFEPGDRVKVFGVIRSQQVESRGRSSNRNQFQQILMVNSMEVTGKNQCSQKLDLDSRVYLAENGIFLDKVSQDDAQTECLFSWSEFKIEHRYLIDQGPTKESRYSGYLKLRNSHSKIPFYNANIKAIKELLQKECAVSGKNINFCTMPLQNYINSFSDETEKITMIMGFTQDGWKLPHNSICIVQDHVGNEIYKNIREVFEHQYDESKMKEIIEKFRKLYFTTGIAHKDQLFQWAIFSPYLYVYREIGGIMPGIAVQGPPQTGKSRFFEMVIKRWFGHHKEVQNGDNIGSASRLESLIASSTLPIFIDDCSNSQEWMVDVLKSYLTLESNFLRKGAGTGGQFATVNKPLCSSLSISCNEVPNWFSDDAFLERMFLEIIDTCEQRDGWFETRDAIPIGSILRILYNYSKNWNKATLQAMVKEIHVPTELKTDSRKKYIYLAFAMGARLLKEIFGIDTTLDRISEVLNRTRQTNMESLLGLIEYQLEQGRVRERILPKSEFQTKTTEYYFNVGTWVKHPIFQCEFIDDLGLKRSGYLWNVNNIRDLQTQFEGNNTKKWSNQTFFVKLQKQFKSVKLGRFYTALLNEEGDLEYKLTRGICIPKDEISKLQEEGK